MSPCNTRHGNVPRDERGNHKVTCYPSGRFWVVEIDVSPNSGGSKTDFCDPKCHFGIERHFFVAGPGAVLRYLALASSFMSSEIDSVLAQIATLLRRDATFLRRDATFLRRDATLLRRDATLLRTFGKVAKSDLRQIAIRKLDCRDSRGGIVRERSLFENLPKSVPQPRESG